MAERRLRRLLSLPEVLMLGIAGTIAAEIFVLSGHVAGMVGPASVLVLAAIGLLNVAVALNYAELATAYPITGGALTYVREGYGQGLLSFLVGSLDCLSSAFYAALSAVGFAYSLRVFLPWVPIVPTAVVTAAVFTALNILGVSKVGRAQLVLGGVLLGLLGTYIVAGLVRPGGFSWGTFMPEGRLFIHDGVWANVAPGLAAMALIFNAFIGYEIIADDAEEVRDYGRVIPRAILISLGAITAVYVLIALVTLGTVPWRALVDSPLAMADAAARFLPRWGAPLVGLAGIIATLTSVNTAMLAATREALTLSRMGAWPRAMARLGRLRTPYMASLVIGAAVALVAAIGLVDLLSYISSSGYLFVVFWASLAMVRLRRTQPDLPRPFRAPWFPLTAYLAAGLCALVVVFTDRRALLFGGGLLVALTVAYYLRAPLERLAEGRRDRRAPTVRDRILLSVANPATGLGLARLAAVLAEREPGTVVSTLSVVPRPGPRPPSGNGHGPAGGHQALIGRLEQRQQTLLRQVAEQVESHNVPFYSEVRVAPRVSEGIIQEVAESGNVRLVLMGWPGRLEPGALRENPVAEVLAEARCDVAVFLNRGIGTVRRILMPFGGGVHSRLALRLASQLAEEARAQLVVLRCFCDPANPHCAPHADDMHDELLLVREVVEGMFGQVPPYITMRVARSESVPEGVLQELREHRYDLVVMGAAVASTLQTDLFGSMTDSIAEQIPCSVLLVRHDEPVVVNWVRRRVKQALPTQ
jgi:APA family basic amino acid/polyamine antiporter